jgi:hypothetical protein
MSVGPTARWRGCCHRSVTRTLAFRGVGTTGSSLGSQQLNGEGFRSRNLPLDRIVVPGAAAPKT